MITKMYKTGKMWSTFKINDQSKLYDVDLVETERGKKITIL